MGKIETATRWMINLANDDTHGYDQEYRWGPNYDCSSSVITAWQTAGVPVKSNGATSTYNMKRVFLECGFSDVTSSVSLSTGSGLIRGDVLLNETHHTVMYIGDGQVVAARCNENGGVTGGRSGDQTGREICIQNYYNFPWDCVLRYNEDGPTPTPTPTPTDTNTVVQSGQEQANRFVGCNIDTDGIRGYETKKAGIKVLQHAMNLDYGAGLSVDGIWGPASRSALGNHYVTSGETQYMVTAAEILVMLRGYNPNGVEYPGTFGSGLRSAINSFKSDNGLSANGLCDHNTFLSLID
ncbi:MULTISPECIES: peptidoglycan-binding domain-containing protein [Clostridium]|uniref:peptidoglycan-binding domain-containing protein n=1 Tax=Clostridium TaxID=1485 RepID=UPI000825DF7F|nr:MULTISPECIES: peptidoglycan amidohydrolase family protein [Clostridium]PJI10481.1 peptidoglycan-binding protein [Clostridium sp. CT7]